MASRKRRPSIPTYDPAIVKQYARGRWADVLANLGGVSAEILSTGHHPCPKCGGKDRFRFTDRDRDGSLVCNQCRNPGTGDGLGSLEWLRECKFGEAVRLVAEYLGVPGSGGTAPGGNGNGKRINGHVTAASIDDTARTDINQHLQPLAWNDGLASLWCLEKPPIKPGAVLAVGGGLAKYRRKFTVVDLPVFGEGINNARTADNKSKVSGCGPEVLRSDARDHGSEGQVIGHCLFNATGNYLPKYTRDPDRPGRFRTEWVKVKLTYGSQPGLIGTLDRLASPDCEIVWLVEGPTDVLAMLSIDDFPADIAVVTHSNGCGPLLDDWMLEAMRGRVAYVIGDADRPGANGARRRANQVAAVARDCRMAVLPWEVVDTHGRDLRDFIRRLDQ